MAEEEEYGLDDGPSESEPNKQRKHLSGPKTRDPYESEDSAVMLPIFVAVGAFIPLVFCMCKL